MSTADTAKPHDSAAASGAGAGRLYALLAEFDDTNALKHAAREIRDAGYTRFDAHSPFPVHGIDELIGIRPTKLPWVVMICGVIGFLTALVLQWWTNASNPNDFGIVPTFLQGYHFLISGKPFFSLPANIPVIFELTVLFSAFGAGFGMLIMNNLPTFHRSIFASRHFERATSDAFFIRIDANDPKFDAAGTRQLLESLGGRKVEAIPAVECDQPLPKAFSRTAILACSVALLPLAVIAMAWTTKMREPRIHFIQDMDNQPRYKAQQVGPFNDTRIMRPTVPGTVARGELREDAHFYAGVVDGAYVKTFPTHRPEVTLSVDFIERGQERFNIYCATCHGRDGSGNGRVNERALELGPWVQASNLHDAEIRGRTVGHLYNTITNGIRTMPAYSEQIPERDRWAIVAYVRALQRSTQGTIEDVPIDERDELVKE